MNVHHANVWFNQSYSNVYDALQIIKQADLNNHLTLMASHTKDYSPSLSIADKSWLEPQGNPSDDDYVAWCIECCRSLQVHLLVPGRRRQAIAARHCDFEAVGTRIMATASSDVLELLEQKGDFYRDLADSGVLLPEYRVFANLPEFDAAYAELSTRHEVVCVKPCVGTFGEGFLVLRPEELKKFDSPGVASLPSCSLNAYRTMIDSRKLGKGPFLLMQYLSGPERSIDCVAKNGRLAAAIARRKEVGFQVLEIAGPAVDIAAALCERYCLTGIFNVQTKDHDGCPHVLEINSRMSGGLQFACHSGIALPYWAILLQLGWAEPEAIPAPVGGIKVAPVQGSIVLR